MTGELHSSGTVHCICPVCLIQNEYKVMDFLGDGFYKFEFVARQWRIRPNDKDGGVNMGNECVGRRCIPSKHRPESWRVHQTHPGRQQWIWEKNFHARHVLRILRILILRHEVFDGANGNVCPGPGLKPNTRRKMLTVPDDRRDSS